MLSEKGKPLPALLPWKAAEKMVPWGVVLLLGGGFALAKGSEVSHTDRKSNHKKYIAC